ncbi:NAD(P)-dependent glycerol-3-phosphate dehydrogenase [Candidatus Dependentiae bacterium]|nr:MAG: NAD(P)-dependent glycerol-3-phosphate dehydrogenase [Candidatus Dependentiae bacterium]
MKPIAILGEGAWGTAVATVLANNGYTVNLWCHDPEVAQTIKKSSFNKKYMPDVKLPQTIIPMERIEEVIADVEWVFEAIPVKYLRSVLEQAKPFVTSNQIWVVLSKGIEQETLLLPMQLFDDVFEISVDKAVCLGPSFAHGVVCKEVTAVVVAASDKKVCSRLKNILANEYFRPYESSDMIGVQVGAALKNVIALGIGILEGAGYGENTKAFVLTKGLHDMVTCAQAVGGEKETIYGLAGVGDLVLTCTGGFSRNVMVGKYFGQGQSIEEIIAKTGVIPEGVNTVKSIYQLAQKHGLRLPVCEGIYDMIFGEKPVNTFLADLP